MNTPHDQNLDNNELPSELSVKIGKIPAAFDSVLVLLRKNKKWVMAKNESAVWRFPEGSRQRGESYWDAAVRIVGSEIGAKIDEASAHGTVTKSSGEVIVLITAELQSFSATKGSYDAYDIGLFDNLPASVDQLSSDQSKLYQFLIDLGL